MGENLYCSGLNHILDQQVDDPDRPAWLLLKQATPLANNVDRPAMTQLLV